MMDITASENAQSELADAAMQLRILSGCHEGAVLALEPGQWLRVGSDDDCDVWLSDCGLATGEALLVGCAQGRWSVQSDAEQAQAAEAGGMSVGQTLGGVAMLGQVGVTICAAHVPWQSFSADPGDTLSPAEPTVQQVADFDIPALSEDALPLDAAALTLAQKPQPRSALAFITALRLRTRIWVGVASALGVGLVALGWSGWSHVPAETPTDGLNGMAAVEVRAPILSAQDQAQRIKHASLAIALVDPALRMHVAGNAEGGVTVSGWVDNVEQFDRLAQGLSAVRPLPRLAVRTAAEVLDALSDAASVHGVQLRFTAVSGGKVQVQGVVIEPGMKSQVLAQLRTRAPAGLEIIDGLRVASEQGPAVQQWLESQGLRSVAAAWDGEQLVLRVNVSVAQRAQLERLLAAPQTPLTDVPFLLQARTVEPGTAAAAVLARRRAGDTGLPFHVRSVIGGATPYLVLADGARLQPGGRHSGWRLLAVESDHLVFDGPKRLEVHR